MIRPSELEDLKAIEQLSPKRFKEVQPDETTVSSAVSISKDQIVAYGALKVFAEAKLVVDPKLSNFAKAANIRRLLDIAVRTCRQVGVQELHVFTGDSEFEKFLESYGFTEVPEKALTVRIGR